LFFAAAGNFTRAVFIGPIPKVTTMPTYIYETIPQNEVEQPKRFEVRQSMADKAFTHHPDTGVPVKRVIAGGTGMMGGKASSSPASSGGGSCGSGCGCH